MGLRLALKRAMRFLTHNSSAIETKSYNVHGIKKMMGPAVANHSMEQMIQANKIVSSHSAINAFMYLQEILYTVLIMIQDHKNLTTDDRS